MLFNVSRVTLPTCGDFTRGLYFEAVFGKDAPSYGFSLQTRLETD